MRRNPFRKKRTAGDLGAVRCLARMQKHRLTFALGCRLTSQFESLPGRFCCHVLLENAVFLMLGCADGAFKGLLALGRFPLLQSGRAVLG